MDEFEVSPRGGACLSRKTLNQVVGPSPDLAGQGSCRQTNSGFRISL